MCGGGGSMSEQSSATILIANCFKINRLHFRETFSWADNSDICIAHQNQILRALSQIPGSFAFPIFVVSSDYFRIISARLSVRRTPHAR
jgi:hypothetical protein